MQHTTYEITLAARNLEGTGPKDIIILKTEDGGKNIIYNNNCNNNTNNNK